MSSSRKPSTKKPATTKPVKKVASPKVTETKCQKKAREALEEFVKTMTGCKPADIGIVPKVSLDRYGYGKTDIKRNQLVVKWDI